MAARLGGQNISTLLESLPGIASVLRSPVADAIVSMIRAGAGLSEFREADAYELVDYAYRRGLMDSEEGEALLEQIRTAPKGRAKTVKKATKKKVVKEAVKKTTATAGKKKSAVKAVKRPAKKTSKTSATRAVKPNRKAKSKRK